MMTRSEAENLAQEVAEAVISKDSTVSNVIFSLNAFLISLQNTLTSSVDRTEKLNETMLVQEIVKAHFKRARQLEII